MTKKKNKNAIVDFIKKPLLLWCKKIKEIMSVKIDEIISVKDGVAFFYNLIIFVFSFIINKIARFLSLYLFISFYFFVNNKIYCGQKENIGKEVIKHGGKTIEKNSTLTQAISFPQSSNSNTNTHVSSSAPSSKDHFLILGYLTSEKSPGNFCLSKNQPLNKNNNEKDKKEQWYRPLTTIIRIAKKNIQEDSIKSQEVTAYLNSEEIKPQIISSLTKIEKIKNDKESITFERFKENIISMIDNKIALLTQKITMLEKNDSNKNKILEEKKKHHLLNEKVQKIGNDKEKSFLILFNKVQRIKDIKEKEETKKMEDQLWTDHKKKKENDNNNENNHD